MAENYKSYVVVIFTEENVPEVISREWLVSSKDLKVKNVQVSEMLNIYVKQNRVVSDFECFITHEAFSLILYIRLNLPT